MSQSNPSRSLQDLINEVKQEIWLQTRPENLDTPMPGQRWSVIDHLFLEALGEIQKDVPYERETQVNTIEFCETFHKNGMTVVPCPEGTIFRVYVVQRFRDNSGWDWSRPAFYLQRRIGEVENWARNLRHRLPYNNASLPKLPMGFEHANPVTDSKHGRAKSGIYAIHDHNLYIGPWIQSNEMVVVEWSGIKATSMWRPSDLLSDEPALKKAIKLHVQFAYERDHGDLERAEVFRNFNREGYYDDALSELALLRREQTRVRKSEDVPHHDRRTWGWWGRQHATVEPTDALAFVFAHIGNNGTPGTNSDAVAALAASWNPKLVLSTGGNISQSSGSYIAYDLAVGAHWYSFIEPYIGGYGQGALHNEFYPTIDDADWANDTLFPFQQFFTLPDTGRYYDVCYGHAHFFFLDSSDSEPDGNTAASVQAEWLKVKLMTSTARWKIVVMSNPPYSSDGSNPTLQWNFEEWGVDLVLAGGTTGYERLLIGNLPFIVNGLGGSSLETTLPTAISGSQFLYHTQYGAGRLYVSDCQLKYELMGADLTTVDTLTLNKGVCADKPVQP